MKKSTYIFLIITGIFFVNVNLFALGGELVFDASAFEQGIQEMITAGKQLTVQELTKEVLKEQAKNIYDTAKTNLTSLGATNWNEISSDIDSINEAADMANSMTYASSQMLTTFENLFPVEEASDMNDYMMTATRRSTGVINTFQGNLRAIQTIGNTTKKLVEFAKKVAIAQKLVKGNLSAQEEGNQIAGNQLNYLEVMANSQMAMASNQAAYYAYITQEKQHEVNSIKKMIGKYEGSAQYKDKGQGEMRKDWY